MRGAHSGFLAGEGAAAGCDITAAPDENGICTFSRSAAWRQGAAVIADCGFRSSIGFASKFKIRNPKSEIRNKFEYQNPKVELRSGLFRVFHFVIRICFEIRASNFGF